ncbi:MAG: cytochrome P460 family protein [Labilithrix sp.]|nr:cytochrome P460 family protein [Labilithrix sp.]
MNRAAAVLLAAMVASCKQDDDPAGARALWDKINAGEGFRSWRRAPAYPERTPSFTAHADAVEIFVSPEMSAALRGSPPKITEWPQGSIVVKEGYRGDTRKLVAVMEKRADGWFWAEYDGEGETLFSGRPKICVDCHDNRATYSDWTYAIEFPR